jgi:hypothetical protein
MHHRVQPDTEFATVSPAGPAGTTATTQRDPGGTMVEFLLVVLIVGILAVGVAFALRSMRATSADSDCAIDEDHDMDAMGAVTPEGTSPC